MQTIETSTIGSAVFAGFTRVTNTQTDRQIAIDTSRPSHDTADRVLVTQVDNMVVIGTYKSAF